MLIGSIAAPLGKLLDRFIGVLNGVFDSWYHVIERVCEANYKTM